MRFNGSAFDKAVNALLVKAKYQRKGDDFSTCVMIKDCWVYCTVSPHSAYCREVNPEGEDFDATDKASLCGALDYAVKNRLWEKISHKYNKAQLTSTRPLIKI